MTTAALTAPQTAPRPRLGAWLAANAPAALALIVFAAALWPTAVLNDSDTWWHLSAGDWIISHHAVPHADPFSWSFAGKPWVAHEWLSEILMSRAFALGGWPGLMLLTAAAAALTVFVLAREAARSMTGPALGLLVLGGAALFGPHLLARPHIIVAPLMAVWFAALARNNGTPPWRILPLMVVWANMHGSFIAGIALSAPFALEATLASADRTRTACLWAAFIGLGMLAAGLTPFGLDGLLFPLHLLTMPNVGGIGEWSPVDLARPQPLLIAILALAIVWLMRRPRLSVVRRLTLLALLTASLHQQRHEMLLGLLGILLLAKPMGRVLGQSPSPLRLSPLIPAAAVGLALLRLAIPLTDPVNARDPAAAIAHASEGRVLNDYAFGGYLIRAGIAPFIDSRADLYGPAFLDRYSAIINDPSVLKAELDRDAIAWTIFKPDSPAALAMERMPGWRKTYTDATSVIHIRTP
jgi:hypothetical protein